MKDGIIVRCPHCGHRLLDIGAARAASGTIETKCRWCRRFVMLDLESQSNANSNQATKPSL